MRACYFLLSLAPLWRDAMPLIEGYRRVRSRRTPRASPLSFARVLGACVWPRAPRFVCCHRIPYAGRQHVQDNHLIYDVQGNQTAVIACRRSMQACRRACVIGILFESAPQRVAISEIVILINPYGRSRGLLHTVFMRTLFTTTRCGRCQGYVDVYHSASSEIHASGSLRLYM
jgi:hypothetical protein